MKNNQLAVLAILAVSSLSLTLQAHAATQTLNGVISDSMCVKKHMMPGKSDAECIKECIKDGSSYVLVVGGKSYTLKAKPDSIVPFAGKHVQVKGDLDQNTLQVIEIHQVDGASHKGMEM